MNKILNVDKSQNVQYCIPLWLRDLQIAAAIKRPGIGRIQEGTKTTDEILVACYGPSLVDTWQDLAKRHAQGAKLMTCSGAHKFLVERGVIPDYHVEVDPRPHKVDLIGEPSLTTKYLIASTCHPKVFDHLLAKIPPAQILLWHVFASGEEAARLLPPEEWAVTGGCSVGLRCLTLSRFLGFTRIRVYGMDGNSRPETGKHAGAHPNQPPGEFTTEFAGKTWSTTPAILQAARETTHETDILHDVEFTFEGEGLVQEIMKAHVRTRIEEKDGGFYGLAFSRPGTISAPYREQNRKLHESNPLYGAGGQRHVKVVQALAESLKTTSVLDYGCGKGALARELPFPIWEYDPAIPEKSDAPRPADLVVCTDVLEHIEPEHLFGVLADLKRCTKKLGFFVIDTGPAVKTLPDGRNTHLIQQGEAWWRKRLKQFFFLAPDSIKLVGRELFVIVAPKEKPHGQSKDLGMENGNTVAAPATEASEA